MRRSLIRSSCLQSLNDTGATIRAIGGASVTRWSTTSHCGNSLWISTRLIAWTSRLPGCLIRKSYHRITPPGCSTLRTSHAAWRRTSGFNIDEKVVINRATSKLALAKGRWSALRADQSYGGTDGAPGRVEPLGKEVDADNGLPGDAPFLEAPKPLTRSTSNLQPTLSLTGLLRNKPLELAFNPLHHEGIPPILSGVPGPLSPTGVRCAKLLLSVDGHLWGLL